MVLILKKLFLKHTIVRSDIRAHRKFQFSRKLAVTLARKFVCSLRFAMKLSFVTSIYKACTEFAQRRFYLIFGNITSARQQQRPGGRWQSSENKVEPHGEPVGRYSVKSTSKVYGPTWNTAQLHGAKLPIRHYKK
jgi:hypothetical protein